MARSTPYSAAALETDEGGAVVMNETDGEKEVTDLPAEIELAIKGR